jgi:hypothetical protein
MFNTISTKIPMTFTTEIGKLTLKFFGKRKTANNQHNTDQEEQGWECQNTQPQTIYYRAIKTVWYSHKNRYEEQWNRRPRYEFMQLRPLDF